MKACFINCYKLLDVKQESFKTFQLNEEAEQIVQHGSHEAVLFGKIPESGILQSELMGSFENAKLGFAKAMANGWINVDKTNPGGPKVTKKASILFIFTFIYLFLFSSILRLKLLKMK